MDLIRKRLRLLSNHEQCPRTSVHEWGDYDVSIAIEKENYGEDLEYIKTLFENRAIKWYMVVEETMNFTTAQLTTAMVESAAHEEIPPLEFNLKAKGDPKLVFKAAKYDIDW